jgi:hypothetical protein
MERRSLKRYARSVGKNTWKQLEGRKERAGRE